LNLLITPWLTPSWSEVLRHPPVGLLTLFWLTMMVQVSC